MIDSSHFRPVRLAELVAALSLGIDLGFGQPMEHVLRQCIIALRLAERLGLDEDARATVYYTALLMNVGSHADAYEQAKWFGDDIALKARKYAPEFRGSLRAALSGPNTGGALDRLRKSFTFLASTQHDVEAMIASHAQLAKLLVQQLGLPEAVADAVGAAYEPWDGRGKPGAQKPETVPIAARIAQLAECAEVAYREGGLSAVTALCRECGGKQFDPALTQVMAEHAEVVWKGMDSLRAWDAVIDAEPALALRLSDDECDAALLAIANFIDLKSPYTLGHSAAVAELCAQAGAELGLPARDQRTLRRAGWVHDFGRLGVSNAISDKPGPLADNEWERVRMQPHLSDRMLHHSALLTELALIVVQHRERLDGSGYPEALSAGALSLPGRVLAAADAYQSMREPRPHRAAHSMESSLKLLRAEVDAGRLDADAVAAVMKVAKRRATQRKEAPAGLSARDVDVLRLLARGRSTQQIAEQLTLSAKAAGDQIEHVYGKINAKTRATVSLFAVQHGLLPE